MSWVLHPAMAIAIQPNLSFDVLFMGTPRERDCLLLKCIPYANVEGAFGSRTPLSTAHSSAVIDRIGGLSDHLVAILKPARRDRKSAIGGAQLDDRPASAPVRNAKHSPIFACAKECGRRDPKNILAFPDGYGHIHPVIVSEPQWRRVDEIEHDVDTLLLEPKSRHLRERRWVDPPDARTEGFGAAPPGDCSGGARMHGSGVARQEIGNDFEAAHVTDVQELRSRGDRPCALAQNAQDSSRDWRPHRRHLTGIGCGTKHGLRSRKLSPSLSYRGRRSFESASPNLGLMASVRYLFGRNRSARGELSGRLELAVRMLERHTRLLLRGFRPREA
jgi:hypothetical protein